MERDTLIKVFALGMIIFFTLELFSTRSAVTNQTQQTTNQTGNETPVYGAAVANATLDSYSNYISIFKQGVDLSQNASVQELGSIDGVGFVNNQSGTVSLVLTPDANISFIAQEVKRRLPDVNVTALALFSIPSEVGFTTSLGIRNVTIPFLLQIETEPDIEVGDNVTLSISGILYGNTFQESPVATIVPTENGITLNATVSSVGSRYYATIAIPWEKRKINASMVAGEFPPTMKNVSLGNYTPSSYVAVEGLNSRDNKTINEIGNLSYVTEVNGGLIYVNDSMNSSDKVTADLKGILGDNTTIDFPSSTMVVMFSSTNFTKEDLLKPIGGELRLYREMILKLGDSLIIGGVSYSLPSSTTFDTALPNDSYSIGSNVSIEIYAGTIGRRVVKLQLMNILG